ncbi:MAG: DNA cytosine methyltransferase [Bacteroidota bacterium]
MKLMILDLFCGQGGAGAGYMDSGFDVVGVDLLDFSKEYPGQFIQADAVEFLLQYGQYFDAIHASPPCQAFSPSTAVFRGRGKKYVDMIADVRKVLETLGKPYVIENVPQAPIRKDISLVGYAFGLDLIKKRSFELGNGLFLLQMPFPRLAGRTVRNGDFAHVVGKGSHSGQGGQNKPYKGRREGETVLQVWRRVMQMPWATTCQGLANAIPPTFTRYIGKNIHDQVLKLKEKPVYTKYVPVEIIGKKKSKPQLTPKVEQKNIQLEIF